MINNIYFDLDECLIYTSVNVDPHQECIAFELNDAAVKYYTIIRPCARDLIAFARDLVGEDRVFILTTSVKEYALHINKAAGFNFLDERVLSREDLKLHCVPGVYSAYMIPHNTADKNNVLIDNLPTRYNEEKTSFLGITSVDQYLETRDYFGVDFPDDPFEKKVQDFLLNQMKN